MHRNPATGRPPGRPIKVEGATLDAELLPIEELPEPPDGLNSHGLEAWQRIWSGGAHLDPVGDYLIVQELCYLIDETNIMRRQLALGAHAGGVNRTYQQGKNGSIVIHPFVNQVKDNRAMIMSWLGGLGFGVLERKAVDPETSDAFTAFNNLKQDVLELMQNGDK